MLRQFPMHCADSSEMCGTMVVWLVHLYVTWMVRALVRLSSDYGTGPMLVREWAPWWGYYSESTLHLEFWDHELIQSCVMKTTEQRVDV